MTYGYWISRARVHLGDATEQLALAPPSNDMDVLAVATLRSALYRQLERNVDLLLRRGTAFGRARREVSGPIASVLNRFRERLHATAADVQGMPSATSESLAAASLTTAVDSLGLAGDILASHLLPQPRTPEGVAIRQGAGVAPALADLARNSMDAVAFDQALVAWLAAARPSAVVEWAIGSARRATTGSMPSVLDDVITSTPTHPRLLDQLSLVPVIGTVSSEIETPAAAATGLRAARTWLWQNPTRVHTVHLRLGTQIGMAINQLAGSGADPSVARAWRRAVGFADDIEGSAPTDEAAVATDRLAEVLGWARAVIARDEGPNIHELFAELPRLADVLLAGLNGAVVRGDIFVNRSRLERARGGVARARTVWLRPDPTAGEIVGLRNALTAASKGEPVQPQRSRSRVAFPRPPEPNNATTPRSRPPAPVPGRRRGRS